MTDGTFNDGALLEKNDSIDNDVHKTRHGIATTDSVSDGLDKLNEALLNIKNGTFVRTAEFSANNEFLTAGELLLFTVDSGVYSDQTNMSYTWNFGDGTSTTTTSETATHSYAQSDLDTITSQTGTNKITVSLKASRSDAQYTDSSGSFAKFERVDYLWYSIHYEK